MSDIKTSLIAPIAGEKIGFKCEASGCNVEKGADYKRLESEKIQGWEDEPIFLCERHSKDHEPL